MKVRELLISGVFIVFGVLISQGFKYQRHVEEVSESGKFTDAFKFGFVKSCTLGGGSDEQCQCAIRYYEGKYSYKEYLAVRNNDSVIIEMRKNCE